MFKLEHHGKLVPVGIAVKLCAVRGGAPRLPHGDKLRALQRFPAQLPDILMQARPRDADLLIRVFAEVIHHVQAKAADAARRPPAEDLVQFLPHGRVFPVEVRLLDGVLVEVILFQLRHPLPGRAAEGGGHVIGRRARFAVTPDIEIMIRIIAALFRLDKPAVFIGGVVEHHVQDDADAPLLCLGNQAVHILERAEQRVDILIVGDIVAVVVLRGAEYRRQPDRVDPKPGQIIEFGNDAGQIPHAVPVCVHKAAGIDLIDHRRFPPRLRGSVHGAPSFNR